jgi:ferredoxin--NADP+ reductase
MRLEDYDTTEHYSVQVKQNTRITPEMSEDDIRELVLEIADKNFSYEVGQSIGVLIPGPHEFGHDVHFRLYTIARAPEATSGKPQIDICVKRCSYIDEYSGEEYKGIASNFLCNLHLGDQLTITGPYGLPFEVPDEKDANLLMIGMGTGIAPFRAFVNHIYKNVGGWQGKVRLFYGAKTGLEMIYMNDKRDDFANYYDEATFEAFKALSPRPAWADLPALDRMLEEKNNELLDMLCSTKTYVYIAGHEPILEMLDKAFSNIMGSKEKWARRKAELEAGKRWVELIYH